MALYSHRGPCIANSIPTLSRVGGIHRIYSPNMVSTGFPSSPLSPLAPGATSTSHGRLAASSSTLHLPSFLLFPGCCSPSWPGRARARTPAAVARSSCCPDLPRRFPAARPRSRRRRRRPSLDAGGLDAAAGGDSGRLDTATDTFTATGAGARDSGRLDVAADALAAAGVGARGPSATLPSLARARAAWPPRGASLPLPPHLLVQATWMPPLGIWTPPPTTWQLRIWPCRGLHTP
jgi:hypothetical protein